MEGYKLRGIHLSFTLIALVFTTFLLWAWEGNPFVMYLLSAKTQFMMVPSSQFIGNTSESLVAPDGMGHSGHEHSQSNQTEETTKSGEILGAASVNITSMFAPKLEDDAGSNSSSSNSKVCRYAKGTWVEDSRRPLYSGFGCKKWLSAMWACRLTQRTDFSYERYRWQPENCEMPEFEPSSFLTSMHDKTIAFIGDSLGRQQFQSLMCMTTGDKTIPDVEDVGKKFGLVKERGAIRPDGWAYRFPRTNTTILYYWSASLADLVPINISDPATNVAMHLDRPPSFMRRYLHLFDILVLNTGHHWNPGKIKGNRWVMHVNGKPIEDENLKKIENAKNFTIHNVVKWLDSQLPLHPRLKSFFRTLSPRHFVNGDWNTGGGCNNTTPLSKGSKVLQNGSKDAAVESATKGTKVRVLDITAISQLRDEAHISRYRVKGPEGAQDCLHWCLPGIPDTWNELLYAQIEMQHYYINYPSVLLGEKKKDPLAIYAGLLASQLVLVLSFEEEIYIF